MSQRRTLRLNELLHAALDAHLQRAMEFPRGTLVTISEVLVRDDLSHARIFVSVLPAERGAEVVRTLQEQAGTIRHELGMRLPLRTVPALHFVEDEREERAARINRLLDQPDA